MTDEQSAGVARGHATATAEDFDKAVLQRRMEEARESITQTVTEIKDTVADQYQSVKESVSETLDWREQYRKHPVEWSVGALTAGFLLGYNVAGTLKESDGFDRLQKEVASIGDRFIDELSKTGDRLVEELPNIGQYLVPALGGVALPLLAGRIKELSGIDLSDYLANLGDTRRKSAAGKARKKGGAKKNGKRKKGKRKADHS